MKESIAQSSQSCGQQNHYPAQQMNAIRKLNANFPDGLFFQTKMQLFA